MLSYEAKTNEGGDVIDKSVFFLRTAVHLLESVWAKRKNPLPAKRLERGFKEFAGSGSISARLLFVGIGVFDTGVFADLFDIGVHPFFAMLGEEQVERGILDIFQRFGFGGFPIGNFTNVES